MACDILCRHVHVTDPTHVYRTRDVIVEDGGLRFIIHLVHTYLVYHRRLLPHKLRCVTQDYKIHEIGNCQLNIVKPYLVPDSLSYVDAIVHSDGKRASGTGYRVHIPWYTRYTLGRCEYPRGYCQRYSVPGKEHLGKFLTPTRCLNFRPSMTYMIHSTCYTRRLKHGSRPLGSVCT